MSREYECPNPDCGEWIEFGEFQMVATCPECQHTIELNVDGEQSLNSDGTWNWKDLTKPIDATARHERQMAELMKRSVDWMVKKMEPKQ